LLDRHGRFDVVRRPAVIGIAAAAVLVLAGGAAAYAYFFSGLRTAPTPLALSTATASPAPAMSSSASSTGLAGTWTVAQGSQAGYRVKETFAGQQSQHEAVARTTSVSGTVTVQEASSSLQLSGIDLKAQLADLQSQDQVAGFNVAQRDRIVSRSLSVTQYPDATFTAQGGVVLPAGLHDGQTVTVTIPGQLTIHGVTRSAQVMAQVRMNGSRVQAAGSTSFAMTDFGVDPPQVPITVVDPQVTLEFQLVLSKP
jgi:polyisoprenoid-binding protein YceI